MSIVRILVLAVVMLGSAYWAGKSEAGDYAVKQKFVLGAEGGWDYLTFDDAAHRLFISRGTHVQVVDPDKGTVVGDIPDTPGVHGIALANDVGKGFISNGRDTSVTVIDLGTLRTVARIKIEGGENPDFIAYEPASRRVFTFNGRSHNATVIDATSLKLLATVPLDGKPEAAVVDGKGMLFVNIEDKNEITELDASKAVAVRTWPLAGCMEPSALAIDKDRRRLFAGCHNKVLTVVDADTGRLIATLPIGEGVDAADFDPEIKLVFSSQADGTLTLIEEQSPETYAVLQNVATQPGARTLALNPRSHDVYLVTSEFEAMPAQGQERPRRTMKAGTFTLLVVGTNPSPR